MSYGLIYGVKLMIIIYIGNLGSGKSLLALWQSLMLYSERQLFTPLASLNSNLTLNFSAIEPEYKINYEQFSKPSQLEGYTYSEIFFDEMWKWADSRLSGSDLNRFLSSFSIITRKNKCNLLLTEQYEKLIDKRIREITNIICYPQQIDLNRKLTKERGEPTYNRTRAVYIPVNGTAGSPTTVTIDNASVWNYYDTHEIPKEFEEDYVEELNILEKKLQEDKFLPMMKTKKLVKAYLQDRHRLSEKRAEIVYEFCLNEAGLLKSISEES